MLHSADTIVAVATPPGRGGIGIVRLSGPQAEEIGTRIFRPADGAHFTNRRLTYGWAIDPQDGGLVDEVLAVFMKAPKTYTGQDVFEIQAHGGPVLLGRLVTLCTQAGARLAGPGEFTWRAFLSGRIDLAQAEAVAELVGARTEAASSLAAAQLTGGLSDPCSEIAEAAVEILAQVEAEVDFPEENLQLSSSGELAGEIEGRILNRLDLLIQTARSGRNLREGARVVLVGRPNVGKSSLLNALLARRRALVSPGPGTTRDYLEEVLELDGLPVVLTDTAGLREMAAELDQPESAGMEETRRLMGAAELVLLVVDASAGFGPADADCLPPGLESRTLLVANKSDLVTGPEAEKISLALKGRPGGVVSAKTGQGLENLKALIRDALLTEQAHPGELACLPNLRQEGALCQARQAFEAARDGLAAGNPPELVAVELKEGLDLLGRISGQSAPEDVLEKIFSRFCVGK